MAVTLEHLSFTALIIPSHDPNSPSHVRNIIRPIKPGILGLISDAVARNFPVQFVPAEKRRSPEPDFLRVFRFEEGREFEFLEEPFETGHALVCFRSIFLPHREKAVLIILKS